jgi:hypothetical protein
MSTPTWSQLRQQALAGLHAGAAPGWPLPAPPVDASCAHQLLLRVGKFVRAARTNWQPVRGTGTSPLPAPPETQPILGTSGEQLLQQMLQDAFSSFLEHYYSELAACGWRVPHQVLGAVLARASQQHEYQSLNEYLPEVLGERGRWLARLHPAWRPLVAFCDERTWTHGTPEERCRFLRVRRRRDPAQGRALLLASLPHDPPELQATLLGVLDEQLEPADEPLLRQGLLSPAQQVRQAAVYLLRQLPENGLVEQLWEWTQQFLSLHILPEIGPQLLVTLPTHWQPKWQQAGIEQEHDYSDAPVGWLSQMLALIPPQRWSEH